MKESMTFIFSTLIKLSKEVRLDNLITYEIITSTSFSDTITVDIPIREFVFTGDFSNVIAVTTMDTSGAVMESVAISSNKKTIFADFLKTSNPKTTHSIMIARKLY